uniref:Uncharacterized protein n=1 Tax=Petromyzon marinus TaxID=7757 RepID=S4RXR9_PETMA
ILFFLFGFPVEFMTGDYPCLLSLGCWEWWWCLTGSGFKALQLRRWLCIQPVSNYPSPPPHHPGFHQLAEEAPPPLRCLFTNIALFPGLAQTLKLRHGNRFSMGLLRFIISAFNSINCACVGSQLYTD